MNSRCVIRVFLAVLLVGAIHTSPSFAVSNKTESESTSNASMHRRVPLQTSAEQFPLARSRSALQSPIYMLWNGFLGMTNILELVNASETPLAVTVILYDINGMQAAALPVSVPPLGQIDLILNDMPGFRADSYGIVELTYSGSALGGRLSFYRFASAGSEYDFAFAVPFAPPLTGESAVAFNTYQPSLDSNETGDRVAQWLSIVNLHRTAEKRFTIYRYDQMGLLLSSFSVVVEPLRRVDLEAGHVNPGPNRVGLHVIVPEDAVSAYLANLVRYGERSSSGASRYAFAFPLQALPGDSAEQWVSISNGGNADDWLEIINCGAEAALVDVEFYDNQGTRIYQGTADLGAYAQVHLHASSWLAKGQTGAARIAPRSNRARIIAQSMFYFRRPSGAIAAMYGSQARPIFTGTQVGSYNLFLGMYNWVRLFNPTSSLQDLQFVVISTAGTSSTRSISLNPYSGIDLGLHETTKYGTALDTFGQISISGTVVAETLRIRPDSSGGIDYAFPTVVAAGASASDDSAPDLRVDQISVEYVPYRIRDPYTGNYYDPDEVPATLETQFCAHPEIRVTFRITNHGGKFPAAADRSFLESGSDGMTVLFLDHERWYGPDDKDHQQQSITVKKELLSELATLKSVDVTAAFFPANTAALNPFTVSARLRKWHVAIGSYSGSFTESFDLPAPDLAVIRAQLFEETLGDGTVMWSAIFYTQNHGAAFNGPYEADLFIPVIDSPQTTSLRWFWNETGPLGGGEAVSLLGYDKAAFRQPDLVNANMAVCLKCPAPATEYGAQCLQDANPSNNQRKSSWAP